MRFSSRRCLALLLAVCLNPAFTVGSGSSALAADSASQRPQRSGKHSNDARSNDVKTIAVLGSSVASGWVTAYESKKDLRNGYAYRLGRRLDPRKWKVVNISKPGDDTGSIRSRIKRDLLKLNADIVIIGLSMSNEGLEEADDTGVVFKKYSQGLQKIIATCRENDIVPVVGLCYANDNYEPNHYDAIKNMNLLINSWDVPSINFLGPLDDGFGNFIKGYTFDLDHPDDRGHRELFYAIVPTLFDALMSGKPGPEYTDSAGHVSVTSGATGFPVSFVPDDVMHSFSMALKVRPSSLGSLGGIRGGDNHQVLQINSQELLEYISSTGQKLVSKQTLMDGEWHDIVITHRHLLGQTELFLDGVSQGTTPEVLVPRQFVAGAATKPVAEGLPAVADYKDLLVYRSPLNASEVAVLHDGGLIQASLEVFAPLNEGSLNKNGPLSNRAQSMSKVFSFPDTVDQAIARLEKKIEDPSQEKIFIDKDAKKAVEVDPSIFDAYVGAYAVGQLMVLHITKEKGRLLLSPDNQGKLQLHPESKVKFFAKVMGPEFCITFIPEADGTVNRLLFQQGSSEYTGKRKKPGRRRRKR